MSKKTKIHRDHERRELAGDISSHSRLRWHDYGRYTIRQAPSGQPLERPHTDYDYYR